MTNFDNILINPSSCNNNNYYLLSDRIFADLLDINSPCISWISYIKSNCSGVTRSKSFVKNQTTEDMVKGAFDCTRYLKAYISLSMAWNLSHHNMTASISVSLNFFTTNPIKTNDPVPDWPTWHLAGVRDFFQNISL